MGKRRFGWLREHPDLRDYTPSREIPLNVSGCVLQRLSAHCACCFRKLHYLERVAGVHAGYELPYRFLRHFHWLTAHGAGVVHHEEDLLGGYVVRVHLGIRLQHEHEVTAKISIV